MSDTAVTAVAPSAETHLDRTERIGDTVVQHGHLSDRVYLLEAGESAAGDVALMERLAGEHGYSKLFAKVSEDRMRPFLDAGFHVEARVPGGAGEHDLVFCSRFLSRKRAIERFPDEVARTADATALAGAPPRPAPAPTLPAGLQRPCVATPSDAEALAALYGDVFASYPFPIHDPRFVRDSMSDGTAYLLIRDEVSDQIVAAASAEPSGHPHTCEMTDFATVPERRGLGLASVLLHELDTYAANAGKRVAYTIARATSVGMNRVFARQGYAHAGTLVNNTNIAGRIESMHVWYRALV